MVKWRSVLLNGPTSLEPCGKGGGGADMLGEYSPGVFLEKEAGKLPGPVNSGYAF